MYHYLNSHIEAKKVVIEIEEEFVTFMFYDDKRIINSVCISKRDDGDRWSFPRSRLKEGDDSFMEDTDRFLLMEVINANSDSTE